MSYALVIAKIDDNGRECGRRVLAHEIPGHDDAERLASRIVREFPSHAFDQRRGCWWFRDGSGELLLLRVALDCSGGLRHGSDIPVLHRRRGFVGGLQP